MMQDDTAKVIAAIWEAAKRLNAGCSGISWNGFNLVGDRKSIEEVQRLMQEEVRFKFYRERVERGEI